MSKQANTASKGDRNFKKGKRDVKKRWNQKFDSKASEASEASKNDSSWYTRNAQLAKDAGNYSFSWPAGAKIALGFDNISEYQYVATKRINGDTSGTFQLPGVMALDFTPTVGNSQDNTSAVNIAAHNIYTFVRHANSGHSNYDAPDLMLYLLAMDQIYMMYSFLKRVYGSISVYSQRNRNMPKLLVEAMGVNFDDVLSHMSDLRYYLNNICLKINSFAVPNTMTYFTRHYWMCQYIYKDADDPKAQMYMYVPAMYGTYVETNGAGYITATSLRAGPQKTFSDLTTIMDNMLAAVMFSEDMNIMSGDILKAYGEGNLFGVPGVETEYVVLPQYNLEVLGQIHNIFMPGVASFANGNWITQDPNTNALLSQVTFANTLGTAVMDKRIMSAFSVSPTEEEVLVNSRLLVAGECSAVASSSSASGMTVTMIPNACASEVVGHAFVYYYTNGATISNFEIMSAITYGKILNNSGSFTNANLGRRGIISAFNFHPIILWSLDKYTSSSVNPANFIESSVEIDFDIDNYAIVDEHDLEKMHDTALLSLFDIPAIGR